MGLMRAGARAITGFLADQFRQYYYADAMGSEILAMRGRRREGRRIGRRESESVIPNGSVIAVNEGQCMLLVDRGRVAEMCAEPGEFLYDTSSEPSLFYGGLSRDGIMGTLDAMADRLSFGGEAPTDQRVYYVNLKEITGNRYGTPGPIPFRAADPDVDMGLRCFGEYSYRIANPLTFFSNVCGNISDTFTRDRLDDQLRSEILTALQPAFARLSAANTRYTELPARAGLVADAVRTALSEGWLRTRGIEIVSFGVSSIRAAAEDEAALRQMGRGLTAPRAARALPDAWICPACEALSTGNFCPSCGSARPENEDKE
ncbi:MAG: SPFH domain-containing protein [Clostridia bacterium]|nr:SPFH domain-containing protein [Clostridia bacterium]